MEGLASGRIWYESTDCTGQGYALRDFLTPAGRFVAQHIWNGSTVWVASGSNATITQRSALNAGTCKGSASQTTMAVKPVVPELDLSTFAAPLRIE